MSAVVLGRHINFRPQNYLPNNQGSVELLAHELMLVVVFVRHDYF